MVLRSRWGWCDIGLKLVGWVCFGLVGFERCGSIVFVMRFGWVFGDLGFGWGLVLFVFLSCVWVCFWFDTLLFVVLLGWGCGVCYCGFYWLLGFGFVLFTGGLF